MDGWEGLPAVSYNILANSLEEKILHMASACIVFGQKKKKLLKSFLKCKKKKKKKRKLNQNSDLKTIEDNV